MTELRLEAIVGKVHLSDRGPFVKVSGRWLRARAVNTTRLAPTVDLVDRFGNVAKMFASPVEWEVSIYWGPARHLGHDLAIPEPSTFTVRDWSLRRDTNTGTVIFAPMEAINDLDARRRRHLSE